MPALRSRTRSPLAGRTAVITGAGSGIGRALALRLSGQGCPIAIVDWDEDGLQETADLAASPVLARKLDVRDRQGQFAFAAEVAAWAPSPVGLVCNNAGVTTAQTVANAAVEDDEWVLQVNLDGVVHGTRAFLPVLQRQGSGTIANVSSVFGIIGYPTQSAYCASKFAVRGFTESLRHELRGTRVRAVAIHPGGIATNIVRNARFHEDPLGSESQEDFAQSFETIATTSPERAAEIIQEGVERERPRILVGRDAVMIDLLQRATPGHYYGVIDRVTKVAQRTGVL